VDGGLYEELERRQELIIRACGKAVSMNQVVLSLLDKALKNEPPIPGKDMGV